MAKPVIGLDYGSSTIQLIYLGEDGVYVDLAKVDVGGGIPTLYFFADTDGKTTELYGYDAKISAAYPLSNRVPCGKFLLKETVELDGHVISQRDILRKMIGYAVGFANTQLRQKNLPPCYDISITFPALFSQDEINDFIRIAETAVTSDGKSVNVVASLPEPAAAALAFLESEKARNPTTVFALDIGAGTTDVALLSAFPEGKINPDGKCYYFEIHKVSEGIKVAGNQFDEAMEQLVAGMMPCAMSRPQKESLSINCENYKKELSSANLCRPSFYDKNGGIINLEVTREQYEASSEGLVSRIVGLVREVLAMEETKQNPPDIFLITGGSAEMPMIKEAIGRAFPHLKDKIRVYSPLKSVATGAAFYAVQKDKICRRTSRSIALLVQSEDGQNRYHEIIPVGQELPCRSRTIYVKVAKDRVDTLFSVCEGHNGNYKEVIQAVLETDNIPAGTELETSFTINGQGVLQFRANRGDEFIEVEHQLRLL